VSPAANGSVSPVWRRLGPALVWDREPGHGAVFDPATGETHFLSELPALIATTLDDTWASHIELVSRYAGTVELDAAAEAQFVAALTSLERAELVESRLSDTDQGGRH
jgi:PqqD family protein of HPr-rel-A system